MFHYTVILDFGLLIVYEIYCSPVLFFKENSVKLRAV